MRVGDVASLRTGKCCSQRHRMPCVPVLEMQIHVDDVAGIHKLLVKS